MSLHEHLLTLSIGLYRLLLGLYPAGFRREYRAEMAQVFCDSCRAALGCDGVAGMIGVWLRTLGDLAVTVPRERVAAAAQRETPLVHKEERSLDMPIFHRPQRVYRSLDSFTKRAKNALQLAVEEARALNHAYIGTEHLLLGLIRERKGVSGEVLHSLGVTLDQARGATQSLVGVGRQPAPELQPLTKRAVHAIERAVEESRQLDHRFVGTEHVLLGIIGTSDGAANEVLSRMGLPADRVRAEVLRVLAQK